MTPAAKPAGVRESLAPWSPASVVCGVDEARGPAEAVEQALALPSDPTGVRFVAAEPFPSLLAAADGADLLVVAASPHSRAAGILLSEVATEVAHRASCDVLIARPVMGERAFACDLLLAFDGSTSSWRAASAAAAITRAHDARLTIASFGRADEPRRRALAHLTVALTDATGHEPVIVSSDGDPLDRIPELARAVDASVVVMGARGVTGLRALGSVSERVSHTAPCSVLITRGGDAS
jgi:nucleotide-binding universal stress UspA family protein